MIQRSCSDHSRFGNLIISTAVLVIALVVSFPTITIAQDGSVEAWGDISTCATVTCPTPYPKDMNGDGMVNVADLLQLTAS